MPVKSKRELQAQITASAQRMARVRSAAARSRAIRDIREPDPIRTAQSSIEGASLSGVDSQGNDSS